jgi:hypothetical protein
MNCGEAFKSASSPDGLQTKTSESLQCSPSEQFKPRSHVLAAVRRNVWQINASLQELRSHRPKEPL